MNPAAASPRRTGRQRGERKVPTAAANEAPGTGEGSLVERAMRSVTDYIQANKLRAGDTLPGEKFFAEHLRVSHTVMREAFRSLAALRVIDVGNGRRARVCAMDSRIMAISLNHAVVTGQISIAEIWEVRRTIETQTAARAAALRTEVEARDILELCECMASSTDDLDRLIRLDIAFHQAIARASRNALFAQLIDSFEPLMQLVARVAWRTRTSTGERQRMVRLHRAIAKAIFDRSAEDAARTMDLHFDHAVERVLHRVSAIRPGMVGDSVAPMSS